MFIIEGCEDASGPIIKALSLVLNFLYDCENETSYYPKDCLGQAQSTETWDKLFRVIASRVWMSCSGSLLAIICVYISPVRLQTLTICFAVEQFIFKFWAASLMVRPSSSTAFINYCRFSNSTGIQLRFVRKISLCNGSSAFSSFGSPDIWATSFISMGYELLICFYNI